MGVNPDQAQPFGVTAGRADGSDGRRVIAQNVERKTPGTQDAVFGFGQRLAGRRHAVDIVEAGIRGIRLRTFSFGNRRYFEMRRQLPQYTLRGSKPVSIAVSDMKMAKKYVDINEMATNI